MNSLRTTTELVKEVLTTEPQSRNSDNYLYLRVLQRIGMERGIDINNMSVVCFLLGLSKSGFPQFESVRRTRQKLQAEHPELRACKEVEEYRDALEKEYREYARS